MFVFCCFQEERIKKEKGMPKNDEEVVASDMVTTATETSWYHFVGIKWFRGCILNAC